MNRRERRVEKMWEKTRKLLEHEDVEHDEETDDWWDDDAHAFFIQDSDDSQYSIYTFSFAFLVVNVVWFCMYNYILNFAASLIYTTQQLKAIDRVIINLGCYKLRRKRRRRTVTPPPSGKVQRFDESVK